MFKCDFSLDFGVCLTGINSHNPISSNVPCTFLSQAAVCSGEATTPPGQRHCLSSGATAARSSGGSSTSTSASSTTGTGGSRSPPLPRHPPPCPVTASPLPPPCGPAATGFALLSGSMPLLLRPIAPSLPRRQRTFLSLTITCDPFQVGCTYFAFTPRCSFRPLSSSRARSPPPPHQHVHKLALFRNQISSLGVLIRVVSNRANHMIFTFYFYHFNKLKFPVVSDDC